MRFGMGGDCLSREIRTAVVAAASHLTRRQAVLALSGAGIELLGVARDGYSALQLLGSLRPDLLIADAELPVMDGYALAARALGSFDLPVRPAVLLLRRTGTPTPENGDLAGASFLEKPLEAAALRAALARMQRADAVFAPRQCKRAEALLCALGVPDHIGRDCLKYAALFCAADERCLHSLNRRVYPRIGEMCALTARQAERAMRHAIDLAWQSDQFDNQYRIFADTVDAARGQPTCSEMISRLADILRLEG